ncbi:MAG: DUF3572 domain-containing protein [Methyloligellaceae bacterium]
MVNKSLNIRGNQDTAVDISIQALSFLAANEEILGQFVEQTGFSFDHIRSVANTTEFRIAMLEFLLSDESVLLTFCSNTSIDPSSIQPARDNLNAILSNEL